MIISSVLPPPAPVVSFTSFKSVTRRRFLRRKVMSMGDNPSMSKIRALFTGTAEEPAREPTNRSASTRLAIPPESPRPVDTVDLCTSGNPSFISTPSPVAHQPHRDAVQHGHALPCGMHKVTPSDRRLVLRMQ